MTDDHPPARDEDVLVLPAELRRQLHPRRGGHPGPAVKIDKDALAWLREERAEKCPDPDFRIARVEDGPDWAAHARRYMAGEADPVGAAVTALILWKIDHTVPRGKNPGDWVWEGDAATGRWVRKGTHARGITDERALPPWDGPEQDWERRGPGSFVGGGITPALRDLQYRLVDAWSTEHSVAFAACALVELSATVGTWVGDGKIRFRAITGVWLDGEVARRMRALLAVADDRDYREAVEKLGEHRRTLGQKAVTSYLVPTRQDWRDECQGWLDDHPYGLGWLHLLVSAPDRLVTDRMLRRQDHPVDQVVTLADSVGAEALPAFAQGLDGAVDTAERNRLLKVIGLMPHDEALRVLVDRAADRDVRSALIAAMTRFPARALRVLAAAGAAEFLAGHVRAHPELVAAMLPGLPAGSRAAVEAAVAADPRIPDAEPDDLPALLVRPPWTRDRERAKPIVIAGLEPSGEQKTNWVPGEREAWLRPVVDLVPHGEPDPAGVDWTAAAEELRTEGPLWLRRTGLLMSGPEEKLRPLLAGWEGDVSLDASDVPWMKCVVGRIGVDALRMALQAARNDPACGALLLPYLDAEIAELMADRLTRAKTARRPAVAWFDRHGVDAARLLFPAALGKVGKRRRRAEGALRLLASRIGPAEITAAARDLGAEAADAIETLIADPLEFVPDPFPVVGEWANPGALPQVLLRGGERALPATAAGHVITMLAMSKPDEPYAGLDVVRELCDGRSLAEFAWALFERWEQHGAPAKDGWAMDQLGLLGDDGTVRALAAAIGLWPGEGGHQKAVKGLDVLAVIGTDLALMHLDGISRRAKFKGLKSRALDEIEAIAEDRGLTREQLADRMVPDFGLDDDGSMTLDYGPRRFTVGFDEALAPFVLDEKGRRRKTLPKPGAGDDPDLAPAAYQRFTSMKKVARTASADQIRRLERAMVTRRRWTAAEFRELFVAHPLVRHVARRLVWLAEEDGAATAFRVCEDRTFADAHDDAFTLPGTASIGIAHPLDLDDRLADWREALDDYEIVQPFPQIERATYTPTQDERRSCHLARFEGLEVRTVRVLALRHRGWERTDYAEMSRPLPDGRRVVVDLDSGWGFGDPNDKPEQRIQTVRLDGGAGFGELDPVSASEVIADLTALDGRPGTAG